MTHRRSKWPTRFIGIDPIEMQECVFLYKAEMDHGSKGLALGHRFGRADNEFLNGPHYCGLAPIFFTVDWTSEAASLHVCETSWLLATASLSAQLLIMLLSISR